MTLSKSKVFSLAVIIILALAFSPSSFGQSQAINGTIRGHIADATGAPVPNVSVSVKNVDTGYTRDTVTDSDGNYLAPNLPLGTYSVTATSSSFAPYAQTGIHVSAGSDLTVDETLKLGSVTTSVEVSSDAPIIETTQTDIGRTISTIEVQNQPLTSRNPYNFILFQPGVSGHPNPENGIPRTVNTNGLVDRVNYQLDGMVDTEQDRYGLRLFAISDSYVQEVQTISNAFNAEFGNTAGVIYNVITPSGTNQLHGSVQYIWRPKAAASCPILQVCTPGLPNYAPKPDLHVDDYVARAGAPVIRNKVFVFGAYEHLKRANPQANTVTATNRAALVATGISPSEFNTVPQVQRAQWVNFRGDYTINSKNTFFVRYNYFRNQYPFNSNVGGTYLASAEADFRDRAHIIGAQLITTFSPRLLNEFRGSWPYRNEQHVNGPLTGPGPVVVISGVTNGFGGSSSVGDKFQEKIPSFSDNVTLIRGSHQFKFGVGFQKNLDTQLADIYVQYTFPNVASYQAALNGSNPYGYSSIRASIGAPGAAYTSIFWDLFAQDTWKISQKLTATYGVRYDQYRAPDGLANAPLTDTQKFRTPEGNFAPRLGLAYQPKDGTVIRLNAGLFYESTPTNTWYNPLYSNGSTTSNSLIASIQGGASAAPGCQVAFPNSPASLPATCRSVSTPYALNPNFKNEYTWNFNLQVAQQISHNDSLTLGYVLTNGRNMQFLRNSNLINPIGQLADGRPVFSSATCGATPNGQTPAAGCPSNGLATRLDTRFNGIEYIDFGSNSSYNALLATYEHRMSAGLTLSGSYTWSHSINDTPEANSYEFSNPVEDSTNRKRDRGTSSVDRPNSFTLSAVYQPETHFENKYVNGIFTNNNFAALFNTSSGDPLNITTGTVLNNDVVASQRPLFVNRNTVRSPLVAQFDLRYTRTLATFWDRMKPSIFIEANNLLNRSNVTTLQTSASVNTQLYNTAGDPNSGINPLAGSITAPPTLARTGTALEARILQFGAKIDF